MNTGNETSQSHWSLDLLKLKIDLLFLTKCYIKKITLLKNVIYKKKKTLEPHLRIIYEIIFYPLINDVANEKFIIFQILKNEYRKRKIPKSLILGSTKITNWYFFTVSKKCYIEKITLEPHLRNNILSSNKRW